MKARGVVGIAFNPTLHGIEQNRGSAGLLEQLAELDMVFNPQVEHDQTDLHAPWIDEIPSTALVDHCGRPAPEANLGQQEFRTLLDLAGTGRVYDKLSGYPNFAHTSFPFADCRPYVRALVDAFSLERCLRASDRPYLRAPERQNVGPQVRLVAWLFPDPGGCRAVLWKTPGRLLGFHE